MGSIGLQLQLVIQPFHDFLVGLFLRVSLPAEQKSVFVVFWICQIQGQYKSLVRAMRLLRQVNSASDLCEEDHILQLILAWGCIVVVTSFV